MKIIKGDFVRHKTLDNGIGRVAHSERRGSHWVAWIVSEAKWGASLCKDAELDVVGLPVSGQPTLPIDPSERDNKWTNLKQYIELT